MTLGTGNSFSVNKPRLIYPRKLNLTYSVGGTQGRTQSHFPLYTTDLGIRINAIITSLLNYNSRYSTYGV